MMTAVAATSQSRTSRDGERGMTMIVMMGMMAVFAIGLLAVAPSVYQDVQREKELEAIRRGEEIAEAIRQYVVFYRGQRLPHRWTTFWKVCRRERRNARYCVPLPRSIH